MKAIYAGSFDPVTLGHLDIIKRASKLFDSLIVAVLYNPNKKCLFTVEERKKHLEIVTSNIKNIKVTSFQGLLADFTKEIQAEVIVRGIRNTTDLVYEQQMAIINKRLNKSIETVFLTANDEHMSLSSSAVKEVAIFGGNIDFMVPTEIKRYIEEKYI